MTIPNLLRSGGQDSKSVRNGVISAVIGGIVLAALAKFWPPFKELLIWLWKQIVWLAGLFTDTYSLPGWVVLALVLFGLPTAVRIVLALRKQNSPAYTRYIEDLFYGAKWRWRWVAGEISNLWTYCPQCDSELVYDDSSCRSLYADIKKTDFICEHCGHTTVASIPGGNKDYALSAIVREIRRKIRTNELPTNRRGS